MEKVLIVDDEEIMRDMIAMVVAEMGYEVAKAVDGLDALEQFQAQNEPFSIVVMDIRMPRLDGIAASQKMKELNPSTKVVLISGNDRVPAGSMADAFLPKPFRVNELCEVIKAVHGDGMFAPWMATG
jgi:CheY-like chemotaxis protein